MRPNTGKEQGFASGPAALACIGARTRHGRGHREELPVREIAGAPRQSAAVVCGRLRLGRMPLSWDAAVPDRPQSGLDA